MGFDSKPGFDAEARAAIADLLAPLHLKTAEFNAVITKLETAGHYYVGYKRRPRKQAAAERDRYARIAECIELLATELRAERRRHGPDNWTRPVRDQLRIAQRKIKALLEFWTAYTPHTK